jgi:hypothetical protein
MDGAETSARVGVERSPFFGLARASGFTEAECRMAAAAGGGRLAAIVRIAQSKEQRRRWPAGHLSGAAALARVCQLEQR